MIVTSKRCFLNKFIQVNTAETVLNANYYMADDGKNDKKGTNSNVNPNIFRNEYGEIIENDQIEATYTSGVGVTNMGSMYHVRRSNILNPEGYNAEYVMGGGDGIPPEEKYIDHLNNQDTMIAAYKFLFDTPLQGNGLQILIFEDDPNIKRYGHILCQFLSMTYGVDIIFLDPAYRPDCRGQIQYFGNKQQGIINAKYLQDADTVSKFQQSVDQSTARHTLSNISEYLENFGADKLMYIYNLIFPNDPLPQGNYTEEQLREILIYRSTIGKPVDPNALSNVLIQQDWQTLIDRISSEGDEFDLDDIDTGLF